MFMHRDGPLYDWLKGQRPMSDCGQVSLIQHLERCGLLSKNLLAVHVNYLAGNDAQLLGTRGVSVVHCPRSHAYFKHDPFPREGLIAAGVNICLGTDSLVSVVAVRRQKPELDMFAEMRAFAAVAGDLPPKTIVEMATVNGAEALGMAGRIGELTPGAFADLIALRVSGSTENACECVVQYAGEVVGSMINGVWAVRPNLI